MSLFHQFQVASRILGNIRGVAADLISVARDSVLAFNALHRKTKEIRVGDMVVVRMGDSKRRTDDFIGMSGVVVYKNTNPVWSRFNVLIDTRRVSFAVDEIEKC